MKIAVTGKGGVGKTTFSALLAHALKTEGRKVTAIDADPDSNLAACLGHPDPESIRPLIELKDLIEERTGVKPGTIGGMFQLNPFVEDIPSKYSVEIGGIRLLVAGAVKKGGAGCYCPENALVRALVSHMLLDPDTDLVLDMEAGIEHLSRGTVHSVDHLIIVLEPSNRSIETAQRIKTLAEGVGIKSILCVGNKVREPADESFLKDNLPGFTFIGFLPYDSALREADMAGASAAGASTAIEKKMNEITATLSKK